MSNHRNDIEDRLREWAVLISKKNEQINYIEKEFLNVKAQLNAGLEKIIMKIRDYQE